MEETVNVVPGGRLADLLNHGFHRAHSVGIATAFMTKGGFASVEASIKSVLDQDGLVQVVHGADGYFTEPALIACLSSWSDRYFNLTYRVRLNGRLSDSDPFNPNLYWFERSDGNTTCIIGSSHLKESGPTESVEVNAALSGAKHEATLCSLRSAFARIVGGVGVFEPTDEFLTRYDRIYRREQLHQDRRRGDDELAGLYASLNENLNLERTDISLSKSPETQLEAVVLAMLRAGPDAELHLDEINGLVHSVFEEFGMEFKLSNLGNSVRRCLNRNTVGQMDGQKLFIRVGGEESRSGRYRLSDKGRMLMRRS